MSRRHEGLWARTHTAGSQARVNRTYRKGTSTRIGGTSDARVSARDARRAPGIPHQTAQQSLGFFDFGAVGVAQTAPLGVEPPPALEAPEAFLGDPQARDARPGAPELAGFEVEKPLEGRGLPGAVWIALAAIQQDHDRRADSDLIWRADRPAASRAPWCWTPIRSRIARCRAPWITQRRRSLGLSRSLLGTRAAPSSAAGPASR